MKEGLRFSEEQGGTVDRWLTHPTRFRAYVTSIAIIVTLLLYDLYIIRGFAIGIPKRVITEIIEIEASTFHERREKLHFIIDVESKDTMLNDIVRIIDDIEETAMELNEQHEDKLPVQFSVMSSCENKEVLEAIPTLSKDLHIYTESSPLLVPYITPHSYVAYLPISTLASTYEKGSMYNIIKEALAFSATESSGHQKERSSVQSTGRLEYGRTMVGEIVWSPIIGYISLITILSMFE